MHSTPSAIESAARLSVCCEEQQLFVAPPNNNCMRPASVLKYGLQAEFPELQTSAQARAFVCNTTAALLDFR